MSTELSKTNGGLPAALSGLRQGLVNSSAQVRGGNAGEAYMKFDRYGSWLYGADNVEVEEDSQWAINPTQLKHGVIRWHNNQPTGELMVPITEPMPSAADLPEGEGETNQQFAVPMKCLSGEDEGTQVLFKTSSHGGSAAYKELLEKILVKVDEGTDKVVPVVTLDATSYQHKAYGKIFKPAINVVRWMSMGGESDPETPDPADEPKGGGEVAEEAKPARRRRRKAS